MSRTKGFLLTTSVTERLLFFFVFLPWILFSIWALLKAVIWKIEVCDDRIVSTSFIGKKTKFSFKDITSVKTYQAQTGEAIKVYVGDKKVFAADPACKNYYVLLYRLKSEGCGRGNL